MIHVGDITKLNGAKLEPVWCITGGSPCQDLSIAGKGKGLAGKRSGLYMEQIRVVKEMREHDKGNGRTGELVRPRYMVWENVPGAFSSNGGADFQTVLEELVRIVEPDVVIPRPENGKWQKAGFIIGDGWSVAWRTHDAQYWGVPQRRRRICLVADFNGYTAGDVVFERVRETERPGDNETVTGLRGEPRPQILPFGESLSGDITASGASGERPAEAAEAGASYAVRIRGGCDGGGKGALVQTEKSGTLGTGNDQTIFCMATQQGGAELRTDDRAPTLTAAAGMSGNNQPVVAIPINDNATRWQGGGESRNHDGSGNGLGIGKEGDPSPTLTAGDRHGVMCMTPLDAQSQRVYDGNGVSPTLSSRENSGLNREAVLCAGFKAGQGAQAGGIGYGEEVSPTLTAAPSGANQTPAVVVLDMTHACDVIRECGEQAPALQARMGTGGNQVPLTYAIQGFGVYKETSTSSTCKQRDYKEATDLVCRAVDCRNGTESEVNGTLQAKESGSSLNLNNVVRESLSVRRLTPLECTRLQGFPDGWVDIGDWVKTDKRGREIKVKGSADSPRYKALGNSIALPYWRWMTRRMARYLPEHATLGSLFDGIGGFPLVWQETHGDYTARWASEIEEFPMAVTKLRFPEPETKEKMQ
jgi:DNA (cytosine-5)-methyltransferase 1